MHTCWITQEDAKNVIRDPDQPRSPSATLHPGAVLAEDSDGVFQPLL